MREGVAVAKPPADKGERSNVVPFPPREVDYAGSALSLMTGLAKSVNDLRRALDKEGRSSIKPKILNLIDRIIATMEMLEEHMVVIEKNLEALNTYIEPGENAYFLNRTSDIPVDIISLIERRQTTLMVQRFIFRAADGPFPMFEHNSNHQVLLTHDGCVACRWPRSSEG